MSDEWFEYLIEKHRKVKEEMDFFEESLKMLSGRLPEVMWDMVIEKLLWDELASKYCVSRAMIGKYRQKVMKELEGLYELRDTQVESYIHILASLQRGVNRFVNKVILKFTWIEVFPNSLTLEDGFATISI